MCSQPSTIRDYPVIQGYVLITGTTFVLVTLAIDLLYIAVNRKSACRGERHDKTPETEHQAGPRGGILGAIVLMTIFAPWLAPMTPLEVNMELRLLDCCRAHPLGTDALGAGRAQPGDLRRPGPPAAGGGGGHGLLHGSWGW